MKDGISDVCSQLQDFQTLKCVLLIIQEALETRKLPKNFLIFNETWIMDQLEIIFDLMRKLGIEVPESE